MTFQANYIKVSTCLSFSHIFHTENDIRLKCKIVQVVFAYVRISKIEQKSIENYGKEVLGGLLRCRQALLGGRQHSTRASLGGLVRAEYGT
jgi:hypothetical protein